MAIDTWLLDQHQHHGHPPTLRFYTWSPAAISLGVSQRRHIPDHWRNLSWQGQPVDLVQRPTGGRGVLHQGDLTYAVITSNVEGSRSQVYRFLCQFLIAGWAKLGISLEFGQPDRDYSRSSNCFALATSADLVDSQGHKVIGSAQLRRGAYLLQHGSISLAPDPELWQQVFLTPGPLPNQAQLAMQHGLTLAQAIASFTQTAADCFNAQLMAQPLSDREWIDIYALAQKNGPECQCSGPSAVSSRR
ncbi:lipoyl protein ligase domain-containing protein [Nodosilinea sp. AN01ver1]|uniref:lipoyl protein ligase domain-containing protein n=1 Tax=Nodosilinea sp. AN01ver1 TaxID=3423362 RepID=UPI003D31D31A